MAAADVLGERVPGADHPSAAELCQAAQRPESGLESAVVGFDGIIRVLRHDIAGGGQQLIQWDQGTGRPKELTLREALVVTCGYLRQNIIEEVWAEIFDVDQSTISRYITFLTPLIDQATAEFRPSAQEAAEPMRGAIALFDGTLWPCWSWAGERELWVGKYKTTGHGSLIVTNLTGRLTFVSEPVPGNQHDMATLTGSECETILKLAGSVIGDKGFIGPDYIITPVRKPQDRDLYRREQDYNNQISSLRAPVERAIANLKAWRILFTDYRSPLKTFVSSFRATIGLYFFKEGFA